MAQTIIQRVIVLLMLPLMAGINMLGAQEPFYWKLSEEHGLPGTTVYHILQDNSGYIWVGTNGGLCKYDGRDFTTFKHPELNDPNMLGIMEDAFGKVWFHNHAGQLGYAQGEELVIVDSLGGDKTGAVSRMVWNKNTLWISGELDKKTFLKKFEFDSLYQIQSQKLFDVGEVYFMEPIENGVLIRERKDNSTHHTIEVDDDIKHIPFEAYKKNRFYIGRINSPVYGNLLIASIQNKLEISKDGEILAQFKLDSFGSQNFEEKGKNWFIGSSDGGFYKIDLKDLSLTQYLKGKKINHIFKDQEGNYWLSSEGEGILVIPNLEIQHFTLQNSNIPNEDVYTLAEGLNIGKILIGYGTGKLSILENDNFQNFNTAEPKRNMAIVPDRKGGFYFGGDLGIIRKFPKDPDLEIGFGVGAIKSMLLTSSGDLWVGSSKYAARIKSDIIENKKVPPKAREIIHPKRTYSLCEDLSNKIWIGTSEGIYYYSENEVIPFTEDGIHESYYATDMALDNAGNIWVATLGEGFLKIDPDLAIQKFNINKGAKSNTCFTVAIGSQKEIYTGTDKGVQIFQPSTEDWIFFDKNNGLPSKEILTLLPSDSALWLGTLKGLVKVPYEIIETKHTPPPVYITEVEINGKNVSLSDSYELTHQENTLSFHFNGLAYKARGSESYRYRLLGLDTTWSTTNNREASFHVLAPGDYTFEVLALNEAKTPSSEPASLKFHIITPWWQTWWFRMGVVLVLIFIARLIYKGRIKRAKLENELQEKIRFLEMEALQKQMNPHFIYNALNAIQDFFLTDNSKSALFYLSRFAKMIRFIFELSRQKTITLEQELEFLNLYLEMEKLRFEDKVTINMEVAPEVLEKTEDIDLPPLLLQPVVENVFKHGLLHKLEGGLLDIRFEETTDGFLKCTVTDNGVGRAKAAELKKENTWRRKKRSTSGLKATKERLKLFHQLNQKRPDNHLTIKDLYNETGDPCGTSVELVI